MIATTTPDVTSTTRGAAQRRSGSGSSRYIANNLTPPAEDRSRWRSERFERRRVSSKLVIAADRASVDAEGSQWVRPRRVARCSWRLGEQVGLHHGPSGAHFSGTERCGSVWSCPVCSAVIRAERAREIESAVVPWLENGGGALFVTGTVRHQLGDLLDVGLNAVLEGWTRVIRGNPWKKWAARIGLVGYIRSAEITYGRRNGWHPHVHGLLLLNAPISDTMAAAFTAWVSNRWRTMVTKLGAREPNDDYGFTVLAVRGDGRVLSSYLAKLQEQKPAGKIGSELARGDLKSGRSGSRMPFELLDTAFDCPDDAALWLDYLDATEGRRCISWSRGLRELLSADDERTDAEIIEDSENGEMVGVLDGETYDQLRRTRRLPELLDQLEAAAAGDDSGDLLHLVQDPPECANDHVDRSILRPGRQILADLRRFVVKNR